MMITEKLQNQFKEEKWTRSTLDHFHPETLDELLLEIINSEEEEEAYQCSLEFLNHSPKSIVALYTAGILSYRLQNTQGHHFLETLGELFKSNKKWNMVEFIATKILDYTPKSISALKNLILSQKNTKKYQNIFSHLQKLLRLDTKDGEICLEIADFLKQHPQFSEEENEKEILKYYQMALRRFLKEESKYKVEDVFKKILGLENSRPKILVDSLGHIASFAKELSISLALKLREKALEIDDLDLLSQIHVKIKEISPKYSRLRGFFVDFFKQKYGNHSQFEFFLNNSGIQDSKVNLDDAIKYFEKAILFEENHFVLHKKWGLGKIQSISTDGLILDFEDKKDHRMSHNMAFTALESLKDDHIEILKKDNHFNNVFDKESMKKIVFSVFKSFSNKLLTVEIFRNELVPDTVKEEDWKSWWPKAKALLSKDPHIGIQKGRRSQYFLRDTERSSTEELYQSFRKSRTFKDRIRVLKDFELEIAKSQEHMDEFEEITNVFAEDLRNNRFDSQQNLLVYMILDKIRQTYPYLLKDFKETDPSIYLTDEAIMNILSDRNRLDYKKDLIEMLFTYRANDTKELLITFLKQKKSSVSVFVLKKLQEVLDLKEMKVIIEDCIHSTFRDNPLISLWILNYLLNEDHFKEFNFDRENLYLELLYRIDALSQIIDKKKTNWFKKSLAISDTKKALIQANNILFHRKKNFEHFLFEEASVNVREKFYKLLNSSSGVEIKHKLDIVTQLQESLGKKSIQQTTVKIPPLEEFRNDRDLWSTQDGIYNIQQKILEIKKEMEQNLVELELARDKGDLRENAEYQASKEKDERLKRTIQEFTEQVENTRIFDLDKVSNEYVAPGTVVYFNRDGKEESYTILGVWDGDDEKNIIPYNTPLAQELLGKKVGETLSFEIAGKISKIKISKIKKYVAK